MTFLAGHPPDHHGRDDQRQQAVRHHHRDPARERQHRQGETGPDVEPHGVPHPPHLARDGFAGLSLSAVAAEAGTTRPAVYRRWKDKTSLAVDAVAHLARSEPPRTTGEPFADLVAELEHFRHCIREAGALPLAGLMLGDGVSPDVRARYAAEIVAPRRARLRACLEAAVERGDLPADADLVVAGSFLTGSWYSLSLVGAEVPDDWAHRVATLVWRACGGRPPAGRTKAPG